MDKPGYWPFALVVFCVVNFSACTQIKSYFPDKEKDYHYSQEIPSLIMPQDLLSGKFGRATEADINQPNIDVNERQKVVEETDTNVLVEAGSTAADVTETQLDIIETDGQKQVAEKIEDAASSDALKADIGVLENTVSGKIAEQKTRTSESIEAVKTDVETTSGDVSARLQEKTAVAELAASLPETTGLPSPAESVSEASAVPHLENQSNSQQVTKQPIPIPKKKTKPETNKVRYVLFNDGSNRMQIDEPMDKTWRIVGKAISHNSIEITGRERDQKQFIVQYDPHEKEYVDGSLWDEVIFFFGDDQKQEKEYRIKLLEGSSYTEVLVADEDNEPINDGYGIKLLQLLFRTIKADLAGN